MSTAINNYYPAAQLHSLKGGVYVLIEIMLHIVSFLYKVSKHGYS
jgi:hypothetical protein